jgi:predicted nucleic acid-binding protein
MSNWVLKGQVQAVTCPTIIKEYRQVVGRAKFRRYGFPPMWLELLIEESLRLPDPTGHWNGDVPDSTDIPFLALAHVSGAQLVTGNLKHFPTTIRQGVQVLTPTEYLNSLQYR